MANPTRTTISRRRLGQGALAGIAALASRPAAAQGVTITVNGSGGSLAKSAERIYEIPFTAATGIRIRATAPVSLAKLKAMVETGNMEWDLTEMGGDDMIQARRNGWLQDIDWSVVDPTHALPDIARQKDGMVTSTFSTVMAYRTDKFSGRAPRSWADFWDVKAFPGPRALQDSPVHNLEFALLADGVAKDALYPLDVDRAFRKLDQIKPNVATWWTTGAQQVQLLVDGEAVMGTVWNGRVMPLRKENKPVDLIWNGGALQLSYWAVPKGAKHPLEAMKFMATRLDADKGAEMLKEAPYPGFTPGLIDKLPPELARQLPIHPDNVAVQYSTNTQWWSENRAKLTERWTAWLLS
jgi:putative spermidine/putrescine transport system substrate-binding protein